MLRTILAVVIGITAWFAVATLLNFGLRAWWPGYASVEHAMAFTLGMQWARLTIGVICSLVAGALVVKLAPRSLAAAWVLGVVMLALFVPEHIELGAKFPLWYHLFFLGTLLPWILLGAYAVRPRGTVSLAQAGE